VSPDAVAAMDEVGFAYGDEPVLDGVTLELCRGEFVALVGPNGSGKSTLLRVLVGSLAPTEGAVRLFGVDPRVLKERWRLGYVPQRPALAAGVAATVHDVVAAGRLARSGWHRRRRAADDAVIDHALEAVGLADRRTSKIADLSGGQQQRAFIAKALVAGPKLLALDEPTAGVDVAAQEALAELLGRLHGQLGVTILYVSHEFGAIEHVVERLVLVRERIVFDGSPSTLPGVWHDPSHVHV